MYIVLPRLTAVRETASTLRSAQPTPLLVRSHQLQLGQIPVLAEVSIGMVSSPANAKISLRVGTLFERSIVFIVQIKHGMSRDFN